jgi:hypothetical protein
MKDFVTDGPPDSETTDSESWTASSSEEEQPVALSDVPSDLDLGQYPSRVTAVKTITKDSQVSDPIKSSTRGRAKCSSESPLAKKHRDDSGSKSVSDLDTSVTTIENLNTGPTQESPSSESLSPTPSTSLKDLSILGDLNRSKSTRMKDSLAHDGRPKQSLSSKDRSILELPFGTDMNRPRNTGGLDRESAQTSAGRNARPTLDSRDRNSRHTDSLDQNSRDKDSPHRNSRDRSSCHKDSRDTDSRDQNSRDKDSPHRNSRDRNSRHKDDRKKDFHDKDSRPKDSRDRDSRYEYSRDKNERGKAHSSAAEIDIGKDYLENDSRYKDARYKDARYRNSCGKGSRDKDSLDKDFRDKYKLGKDHSSAADFSHSWNCSSSRRNERSSTPYSPVMNPRSTSDTSNDSSTGDRDSNRADRA